MSRHRKPDEEPETEVKQRRSLFDERNLPHISFACLTALWLLCQFIMAPGQLGTINQAWAATLALWFSYLIRDRTAVAKEKEQ